MTLKVVQRMIEELEEEFLVPKTDVVRGELCDMAVFCISFVFGGFKRGGNFEDKSE